MVIRVQLYGFGEEDRIEVVWSSGRWGIWPGLRTIVTNIDNTDY